MTATVQCRANVIPKSVNIDHLELFTYNRNRGTYTTCQTSINTIMYVSSGIAKGLPGGSKGTLPLCKWWLFVHLMYTWEVASSSVNFPTTYRPNPSYDFMGCHKSQLQLAISNPWYQIMGYHKLQLLLTFGVCRRNIEQSYKFRTLFDPFCCHSCNKKKVVCCSSMIMPAHMIPI